MNGAQYFQTFCIQSTVYFTPGVNYSLTLTSSGITLGTAWLYSQFAAGTLSGYDYSYGLVSGAYARANDANLLQQAIWGFQGQAGGANSSSGNVFYNAAVTEFGSVAAAEAAANGAYGVVEDLDLADAQNQLVITAPEPASILAACLLLALPIGASSVRILLRKA